MAGKLIVGGVAIGNFKDIPQRTIEAIESVDLIVAEHGVGFKNFLDKNKKAYKAEIINYLPEMHNPENVIKIVHDTIIEGKDVLLLSNEGMPLIHDPGWEIVKSVVDSNLNITVIPGPSAPIAALCVSGLETVKFIFDSDAPQNYKEALEVYTVLKNEKRTTIYFDKIINVRMSVEWLNEIIGPERKICICIDLTEGIEKIITRKASDMLEWCKSPDFRAYQFRDVKVVLIVEGAHPSQ
jgi:16S rRNA (cytidine1402-2'-O)-methyltransferase